MKKTIVFFVCICMCFVGLGIFTGCDNNAKITSDGKIVTSDGEINAEDAYNAINKEVEIEATNDVQRQFLYFYYTARNAIANVKNYIRYPEYAGTYNQIEYGYWANTKGGYNTYNLYSNGSTCISQYATGPERGDEYTRAEINNTDGKHIITCAQIDTFLQMIQTGLMYYGRYMYNFAEKTWTYYEEANYSTGIAFYTDIDNMYINNGFAYIDKLVDGLTISNYPHIYTKNDDNYQSMFCHLHTNVRTNLNVENGMVYEVDTLYGGNSVLVSVPSSSHTITITADVKLIENNALSYMSVADTLIINSQYVAANIKDVDEIGIKYIVSRMNKVYVRTSFDTSASDYLSANFDLATSNMTGYNLFVKKSA